MKTAHLIAPLIAVIFCAHFAWAQTTVDTRTQEGVGGSSGDMSSAGYMAKAADADPGVGTSQSSNYLYDHGTLWFDDGSAEVPPAPTLTPTGSGGSGGGSSGSGWIEKLFGDNPQTGVLAPKADVPFTDTPEAASAVAAIPEATQRAVKITDAPVAIDFAIANPQSPPQIIRLVDETGMVRELNIVLFKRIVPWPLWIAFLLIALGAVAIALFVIMRGFKESFLWIGGVLTLIGIVTGIVVRFAYRAVPIDTKVITSISVVPVAEARAAVKKLMVDMPLGVHVVEAVDGVGKKALTVKVFITPALPI